MFTEMLPEDAYADAARAAAGCDVLISIGTSAQVWPAADVPLYTLRAGGRVVIVNLDFSGQPAGARVLQLGGPAGEIMPRLLEAAGLSAAHLGAS
jgi:NAD-dependent deacetylase